MFSKEEDLNDIDSKLEQCQRDLQAKLEACEVTKSEMNESKKNIDAISERIRAMASECDPNKVKNPS